MTRRILPLLAAAAWACGTPQPTVPLYDNLGDLHVPITTDEPLAQQYFNQGIRLAYGFNHEEAIKAFREAARLDPECAMCYWGVAYALGPNINIPMDTSAIAPALEAVGRAAELAPDVSPREQAFIAALARRYTASVGADRAPLDSAYADAMRGVAEQFPDDDDAQTLYAESLMMLRPWNYWTGDKEPQPGMAAMLEALAQVVGRSPRHPGACHFYIHAVEAAYPERAVECAERLASLMPGAGHLVHMPAHVYIRVGRYADAIEINRHAVHADETYIADANPQGLYPVAYYPHNYHFLAFAALMAGQSQVALDAARKVVATLPKEVALLVPFLEGVPAYVHLALTHFGRWEDVLAEPMPPADMRTATGLAYYARGVASAATGRWNEAGQALDSVRAIADASLEEKGEGGATQVLQIAVRALAGEIHLRRGMLAGAIREFEAAKQLEDALPYDEPPPWYYPIRQALGAALLGAGRAADAERAFREDLDKFPRNGWSLYGLMKSLEAQGKRSAASEARQQFDRAWASADVQLTSSHF